MAELACKYCHLITEAKDKSVCPICKRPSLSNDWAGYVIVLDPANSTIARKLGIEHPGKYALKVR